MVLQADRMAVRMGSPETITGAPSVAASFSGRALGATPALIDGIVGVLWAVDGRPKVVWDFSVRDGAVVAINMIADPDHLASLDIFELQ